MSRSSPRSAKREGGLAGRDAVNRSRSSTDSDRSSADGVAAEAAQQADRQRDRETERQRDRETERRRDRETERQRDGETERQRRALARIHTHTHGWGREAAQMRRKANRSI